MTVDSTDLSWGMAGSFLKWTFDQTELAATGEQKYWFIFWNINGNDNSNGNFQNEGTVDGHCNLKHGETMDTSVSSFISA